MSAEEPLCRTYSFCGCRNWCAATSTTPSAVAGQYLAAGATEPIDTLCAGADIRASGVLVNHVKIRSWTFCRHYGRRELSSKFKAYGKLAEKSEHPRILQARRTMSDSISKAFPLPGIAHNRRVSLIFDSGLNLKSYSRKVFDSQRSLNAGCCSHF